MTICLSIMQFAMFPIQGFGQGAQPIASFNYGARKPERVQETFRLLLTISMVYAVIMYLGIMLFPRTFVSIFSGDAGLIDYAARALRVCCGAMFLFSIQLSCQALFTSIGYALCSIIVAVVRKFVLLIPLIYVMPALNMISDKAMAVFAAEPVADTLAVTFTAILFAIQFRKAMKKLAAAA